MLCTNCIHKEVCKGLFPADKQECKYYQGVCENCYFCIVFDDRFIRDKDDDNYEPFIFRRCAITEHLVTADHSCKIWRVRND